MEIKSKDQLFKEMTDEEKTSCMYSNYLDCKYLIQLAEVRLEELKKEKSGRDNAATND